LKKALFSLVQYNNALKTIKYKTELSHTKVGEV